MFALNKQEVTVALAAQELAESELSKSRYMNVAFAVLATISVGIDVFERWHAYRLFDKCYAIFVLVFLGTLPWSVSRMEKRSQRLELWLLYLVVMMVTVIFR